jgi:hypothetical protein
MAKEMKIINWEQDFVDHRIASAVKIVEFVSDRMSHIELRGRWCNIIVLNAQAPTEKKGDDSKDSFYEGGKYLSGMFFLLRMVYKKEVFYRHCLSTLF